MKNGEQGGSLNTGTRGRLDRRQFIRRSGMLAATLPWLSRGWVGTASAASKAVSFACYGGSYNDNITKAFLTGFEAKTGIKVNLGDNASLALAKLQAAADPAQWDIVELDGPEYEVAIRQNLLLPYDYTIINAAGIPAE